jgi:hypothetical protein
MKRNASIAVTILGILACVAAGLLLVRRDDSRTGSQPTGGASDSPKTIDPVTLAAQPQKVIDANESHPSIPSDDLLAVLADDGRSNEPIAKVVVVGRVVDERRRPVAGATVRVLGVRFFESSGTTGHIGAKRRNCRCRPRAERLEAIHRLAVIESALAPEGLSEDADTLRVRRVDHEDRVRSAQADVPVARPHGRPQFGKRAHGCGSEGAQRLRRRAAQARAPHFAQGIRETLRRVGRWEDAGQRLERGGANAGEGIALEPQ